MNIPDKYLNGSVPLDSNREDLARVLLGFIAESAGKTTEEKSFCESMGLGTIVQNEKDRMSLEIMMFSLFMISQWINQNYEMNGKELLDRMFFLCAKAYDKEYAHFWEIVEERFGAYDKASHNTVGSGPMYWLGKEATLRILGMDEKDADVRTMLTGTIYISTLVIGFIKGVKEIVDMMNSESTKKVAQNKSLWKKTMSFLGF